VAQQGPGLEGQATRYRFGEHVLDVGARALSRGEQPVRIEPKAYAALLYLVEQRHRAVSRTELLSAVWHDAVVVDDALSTCIRRIRRSLDQAPRSDTPVRTVHRVGYQFVAHVEVVPPELADSSGQTAALAPAPHHIEASDAAWPTLQRAVERSLALAADGEVRLVALQGDAGMGKTHWARRMQRLLRDEAVVFVARGAGGEEEPLGPWVQLLQACLGHDAALMSRLPNAQAALLRGL